MPGRRLGELLREGFLIGGWVAMWRPLEIFLYDWWPIRAQAQLYDRLRAISSEYNGKAYYFCSKGCKAKVDANAGQLVK